MLDDSIREAIALKKFSPHKPGSQRAGRKPEGVFQGALSGPD